MAPPWGKKNGYGRALPKLVLRVFHFLLSLLMQSSTCILKVSDGRLSRITNSNRKMGSITKLCAIQSWKLCVELTVRTLDTGKPNCL